MKPTIYDIAEKSGFSIATVSRVLNNKGKVKPSTLMRIRTVMDELNYVPSQAARGLAKNEYETIRLQFPENFSEASESEYYLNFLNGVVASAAKYNYSVLVDSDEKNFIEGPLQLTRGVDGVIYPILKKENNYVRELISMNFPVVYAGSCQPFDHKHLNIYGGYLSLRKEVLDVFIKRKYEKILFLESELFSRDEYTLNAIDNIIVEYNTKIKKNDPNNFFEVEEYKELCSEQVEKILMDKFSKLNKPNAIFLDTLDIHPTVYNFLLEHNYKMPEEVALISVVHRRKSGENVPIPLTTVFINAFEMGKKSVEKLLELINDQESTVHGIVPFEIIYRDSLKE